jgi:hypothetical protein
MVMADRAVLQCGVLRCVLDGADVRELSFGGQRVLTRLYIAVRDEKWNTIPFAQVVKGIEADTVRFHAQLWCTVDKPPIRAEWEVVITGSAEGEFSYAMSGRALSAFSYAKLGLNLHHPLPESLGARYLARRGEKVVSGVIPNLVEPQCFVDGQLTGMFMPHKELTLQSAADDTIVFEFGGEEFEMQDHRNWTDYNLKSYGTPLEVPLPLHAQPGQQITQSVTIDLRGAGGGRRQSRQPQGGGAERVSLAVDRARIAQLPLIGSEYPDEVTKLDSDTSRLIGALGLKYVRLNLDLTSHEGTSSAAAKARQILEWGYPIELALVVSTGETRQEELARLEEWLAKLRPSLARVVVLEAPRGFFIGRTTTAPPKVRSLRGVVERWCGPTSMVSATEQFFAELNRWWPELAGIDGVGYTICPQVHAADDTSLMENSFGQADTVLTARARSGGKAVHITSIAMIGKFGPYPGGIPEAPVLPAYGDSRQHELFGAAWTVSSLRQLVDAHACSATYFELSGERGLVHFPGGGRDAVAGPVYRVLEAVLSWEGGNLVSIGTGPNADLIGLGMEWPGRSELLVANLSPEECQAEVGNLAAQATQIDELKLEPGGSSFWAPAGSEHYSSSAAGALTVALAPYGVARLRTK